MVQSWSNDYKTGSKIFADSPTVPLHLWTSGYKWAKNSRKIIEKTDELGKTYYYTHADVFDSEKKEWIGFNINDMENF